VLQTTIKVRSGEVLAVFVGEGGVGTLSGTSGRGGFNGGGPGGDGTFGGAGGGGASSVHALLPSYRVSVGADMCPISGAMVGAMTARIDVTIVFCVRVCAANVTSDD
jgi:hypothetical protein